ncbi:MAG: TIGR01777 family oxidoreductase [Desulfobacterales bacterium]
MDITVIGATGFLGGHLIRRLHGRGHRVVGIARRAPAAAPDDPPRLSFLAADATAPGDWQSEVARAEAVVNLAGRSIAGRWSEGAKREIRASRIETTRRVVEALPGGRCRVLLNASGVGYYGDRGDEILSEGSSPGTGFLAGLAADWEAEALAAAAYGVRVVPMRFGVVLGTEGGALARMVPAFRSFLGGPLGSGSQWFSWIHVADLVEAIVFLLERDLLSGPVNLCAPEPVTQRDFAAALGRVLRRPSGLAAPAFLLRLALGEAAGLLLDSQRAVPARLLAHGFVFRHPALEPALADLLRKNPS